MDFSSAPEATGVVGEPSIRPTIRTRRLDLRPIAAGDVYDIAALHADPRVSAQLVDAIPDTPAKARVVVSWNAPMAARGFGTFAVRLIAEPELVGLFSLVPFDGNEDLLELGGKMHPSAWRGSLALEAALAMLGQAFGPLRRTRVISAFHPGNDPAHFLLKRLGFTRPRSCTLFGRSVTTVILDRQNWKAQGRTALPARVLKDELDGRHNTR